MIDITGTTVLTTSILRIKSVSKLPAIGQPIRVRITVATVFTVSIQWIEAIVDLPSVGQLIAISIFTTRICFTIVHDAIPIYILGPVG